MENLQKRLSNISTGKILDVGTGRGEFIRLLKESLKDYQEIIGIDFMDRSINYCNENFNDDKIHFIKMDSEKMTFEDDTFDMVCISNTLHHLPNCLLTLEEMKRVLKPGGYFLISEMFSDNQTDAQLSHVNLHHFGAGIDESIGIYHDLTYTRDKIIGIAKSLNLEEIEDFDYRYISENPKDPELIDYMVNMCDQLLERANGHADYEKHKLTSETIKQWIKAHGYQSATELMIIGKK